MHGNQTLSRAMTRDKASPQRHWLTLATLCLAVLVAQVDTSVVNLAVKPIGTAFHAGVGALQWVVDSYNLLYALLLLTGGLLADLYGRRLIFMTGAVVFAVASLACAAAPTVAVLIGARALAGLGAALLLPASLAIIRVAWPDPVERGRALGIWAACNGLAFVVGPTIGGFLIHGFGWRSIFLVVIPLAIAALALAPVAIRETSDPHGRSFDAAAQGLGALALGSLAFAAIETHGDAALAAVFFAVAVVALVLFVRVEVKRGSAALVPLDMFAAREFRGAIAATAGMTFGMYGALFLVPMTWLEAGRLGPVGAGLALMPMALAFVIISPFSGSLTERFGSRITTAGGVAVIGCGLLVVAAAAGSASILGTEIGLTLTGIGMGFATGPLMALAVGAVSASRSGTASALINVARMVGATVGVAVLGTAFAMAGGGESGLRLAMVFGGAAQLAAAGYGWRTTRPAR
jgi:EmrB/QacA subfamily drug resistance transporter